MKTRNKLTSVIAIALIAIGITACADGGGGNGQNPDGQKPGGGGTGTGTAPTITTVSLPNGAEGTAYNQTVTATGDTPITWSLESGTLPTGLSLAGTGVISGTPATAGAAAFTVKATNAAGSSTKPLSITITSAGAGGGKGWIVAESPFTGLLATVFTIVFGNDKFVAVGYNASSEIKISTSPDGITWSAGTDLPFGANGISDFIYGNGTFVISEGTYYKPRIAYSSDGVTWTVIDNPFNKNGNIFPIAYGNGMFVAVIGNTMLAYSSDGATWTTVPDSDKLFSYVYQDKIINSGTFYGIAWGNGKFVTKGLGGFNRNEAKIATSPDGITWKTEKPVITTFASFVDYIFFGNGKFVSWGEELSYSEDGITWTGVLGTNGTINAIAFGNNKFVIGGNKGKIMYSSDGVTWTAETDSPFSGYINAIAYGKGKFVAGSNPGLIAYLLDD